MTDTSIDHFKCEVRRFDTIDNEIKHINDQMKPLHDRLKELKSTKKTLEDTICSFMQTNEISQCKLGTGTLQYKESKNVVPLKKDSIKDNIQRFFSTCNNDEFKKLSAEEKADQLFKFVYETREYKDNFSLKRV